mmetsp:Transcript_14284/g.22236  ORF Transcript_14284/g.22236 Transcript_14284/m.22236 type:complete len:147 (-) Transcript_14284:10-450(-)
MQIFMICCGRDPDKTINQSQYSESWFKFFVKFKDFLLISICDNELVEEALLILHNFLTSPSIKFQVYEDCKDSLLRSIELLYDGQSSPEESKEKFREYLLEKVVNRTEDTDNALKKFFKSILQRLGEEHNEIYLTSNITDIMEKLV